MKFSNQKKTFFRRTLLGLVLSAWIFAAQTAAATLTVTNTSDAGAGSLRQAVADANATGANDTIEFSIVPTDPNCNASGVCTITLTSGFLLATATGGTLTISNQTGAGKLWISGNNANQIFRVGANANVTLDGITFTNGSGSPGFGVVSNLNGTLTVSNCVFTANTGDYVIYGGASQSGGVLNVVNTTVHGNSGVGIFASNNLTDGGTANIVNSTVSNNTAAGNGAGIYFLGVRMTITNSTVSGNLNPSGGAGIFAARGEIVITNSTVSNNQGGIGIFWGVIEPRNTIIAGNAQRDVNFLHNQLGFFNSDGNNLIGNATNTGLKTLNCAATDLCNQTANLAPLGNYGGATQTHALLPNSPAINAGNNCVLTANGCGDANPAIPLDQRGKSRVGAVDIGSFEFVPRTNFDFDGDGRADLVVFRPSDRIWYLQNSTSGFFAAQFGLSADKIVPADFDGDGLTDIAVFRDGVWYWLASSTGVFNAFQFGTTGDIPVPADFTGDRRTDIAVYRGGTWYLLRSNAGFDVLQFGLAGDKPIPSAFVP